MSQPKPYSLNSDQAILLAALFIMPIELRRETLEEHAAGAGPDAIVDLLLEFVSLAKSVEENARGYIECMMMAHGAVHSEREADHLNAPSIVGALEGIRIARAPTAGMCGSCAFRLGSVPNQCLPTVQDALHCIGGPMQFNCHQDLNEEDEGIFICAGFAAARAEAAFTPFATVDSLDQQPAPPFPF